MKLSVIVPAFNLETYITECLVSLCEQQTTFEFEVLVCDDASTDQTAKRIAELGNKYPCISATFKQQNAGLAENMRTLLAEANGDYIAYVDGDDVALPGKLQKQVDYLEANPQCHMVFHESDMFDSQTNQSLKRYSEQYYNWSHIPAHSSIEHLVKYGTYMQASSVMFRRHDYLLQTVLPECKIILDYPFYIMNAGFLNARIDFIPEVLGRYRIHSSSFGAQTQKSVGRRLQSLADIIYACEASKQFNVDADIICQGVDHHLFAASLYFLFKQNDTQFTSLIERSAQRNRFFNDRHELAWRLRSRPDDLRLQLAS